MDDNLSGFDVVVDNWPKWNCILLRPESTDKVNCSCDIITAQKASKTLHTSIPRLTSSLLTPFIFLSVQLSFDRYLTGVVMFFNHFEFDSYIFFKNTWLFFFVGLVIDFNRFSV